MIMSADDERISIERAPSDLTDNLSKNIKEIVDTLGTIGDLYLKVYHGESFPYEEGKKKETVDERTRMLKEENSFFPRYEAALEEIGNRQTYEFSPLHMVGDSETVKIKENRRSISMGSEKMRNLSSLESSVDDSTFKKTVACMMAILASRQYAGRAANAYPLCLFVAPGYNETKEIEERKDSAFEKTSMRRYDRIVFTSKAKIETRLPQEEPVHWVAFALLSNKEYWSDRGPYIKVWCNLDPDIDMTDENKTEYTDKRKAIGEAVLIAWRGISENLIQGDKIFHKETVFSTKKDPMNKVALQNGDIGEATLLYGRMIDYTGSREPHSIFWPMTQCSMYRGLDMFVKSSNNAETRMYTKEATGQGGTNTWMTSLLERFIKKKGRTEDLDMSASLLWTTGVLVKGVSLYTRHTRGEFLKRNGYTLNDKEGEVPTGVKYGPVHSLNQLKEHNVYARPHLKKEDAKKITQSSMLVTDSEKKWKSSLESEMEVNEKKDGFFYTTNGSIREQIKAVLPYLWHPVLKSFMNRIEASPIGTQLKDMEGTMMDALNDVYPDVGDNYKPRTTKHPISEDLVLMQTINIGANKVDRTKLNSITRDEKSQVFNPILVKAYQVTQKFSLVGKNPIFKYLSEGGEGASQTMYYLYRDRERILQAYDFFARNLILDVINDNTSPYDDQWFPGVTLDDDGQYIGGFYSPNLIAGEISSWMLAQHTDSTVSKFYGLIGGGDRNKVTRAIAKDVLKNYKTQDWYKMDSLEPYEITHILDDSWTKGLPFGVRPIQAGPESYETDKFMKKEEVLKYMDIKDQKKKFEKIKVMGEENEDKVMEGNADKILEYLNYEDLLYRIRVLKKGKDIPLLEEGKNIPLLDLEKLLVTKYKVEADKTILALEAKKEALEKTKELMEKEKEREKKEKERKKREKTMTAGKKIETKNKPKIKEFMSAYDEKNKQKNKTRALNVGKKITKTLTDKHMTFFSQHSVVSEHCAHREKV